MLVFRGNIGEPQELLTLGRLLGSFGPVIFEITWKELLHSEGRLAIGYLDSRGHIAKDEK